MVHQLLYYHHEILLASNKNTWIHGYKSSFHRVPTHLEVFCERATLSSKQIQTSRSSFTYALDEGLLVICSGLGGGLPKMIMLHGYMGWSTLPETNIAPENCPSQKEISIPTIHFQGAILVSGREVGGLNPSTKMLVKIGSFFHICFPR